MSQTGTEFRHFVHLVHALASEEVQTVEVLLVFREQQLLLRLLDRDDRLEDGALAFLDPLTHRVQVGGEVNAGREDALVVLTLRLAVELFPPLREEVELGLVVHHDLYLLAVLVKTVTNGSILGCGVLGERHILTASLLHILGTGYEFADVKTCTGDRQQSYWCEHRETATHVVGDDE